MLYKFKTNFLFILPIMALLLCVSFFNYSKLVAMDPADANLGVGKEELAQLNKEFDGIKAEFASELPALEKIKAEFDDFLKNEDLYDTGLFKDFRNKVLCSYPSEGNAAVGIYGADVLKILFLISYVCLDKIFFNKLKAYYTQSVVSNFKEKKELLISLYDNKVAFKDTKKFLSDAVVRQSFAKEICLAFCVDDDINSKLISYIFLNLTEKECAKFFEHQVFPTTSTSLFRWLKSMDKKQDRTVVSAYSLLEFFITIAIYGMRPTLEENLHTARSFLLNFMGWNYRVLDSYAFDLSKRMLIQVIFLKRLNLWYQNRFKEYLKDNMPELLKILSDIKIASESGSENSKEMDEVLKDFMKKGYDCSFSKWFSYKNGCCANFGLLIEGIILLPVICKGSWMIYRNFAQEG